MSFWVPFPSTFLRYGLSLNMEMTDIARLAGQWASEILPSLSPQPRNYKCKPLCPAGDTSSSGQAFVEAHYQSIPLHRTQTWYFRFWFYFLLHLNGDCSPSNQIQSILFHSVFSIINHSSSLSSPFPFSFLHLVKGSLQKWFPFPVRFNLWK